MPRRVIVVCLLGSLFLPARISAQATGAIAGLVSDSSGAVLPGVTIEVTSPDTGQVRAAVTAGDGFYTVPLLNPGPYQLKAALGGQAGDATPGGFGNVTGGFNVNGQRNQSNNFLLDGSPNNDSFNTGFVLRPPPDAIQEFKILTHSYDAEYGRNAGSVVNVVTRSGTNRWQGSAWEFNRDDTLQARNYFATTKPALKQNQYGGALGGPLVANRLFMFSYFEGFKNRQGMTDTRVVLSTAQRNGDFSGGATVRDPVTGQAFPNNVIPAGRISPIAKRILDQYVPLPNSAGNRVVRSPDVRDSRQ